jgi:hypothetical protein
MPTPVIDKRGTALLKEVKAEYDLFFNKQTKKVTRNSSLT